MHAANEIIERELGGSLFHKFGIGFKPVYFHTKEHPARAPGSLQFLNLPNVIPEVGVQAFPVFMRIRETLRPRAVFGEAENTEALVHGGLVHVTDRIPGMRITGMIVQIGKNHGGFSFFSSELSRGQLFCKRLSACGENPKKAEGAPSPLSGRKAPPHCALRMECGAYSPSSRRQMA